MPKSMYVKFSEFLATVSNEFYQLVTLGEQTSGLVVKVTVLNWSSENLARLD